jgi:hypothetical protein
VSLTVCICPRSCIGYPTGGGYLWIFLNWALGLRSIGCNVIWLEEIWPSMGSAEARDLTTALMKNLQPYGLSNTLALHAPGGGDVPPAIGAGCLDLAAASEADVLLNFRYSLPPEVLQRFRRSALVDIDPGLLQTWMAHGFVDVAEHDVYLTIGEHIHDPGRTWHHVPPCVSLDWWTSCPAPRDAAFTTVGHWYAGGWVDADEAADDKRSGFLPHLDLPQRTSRSLEMALDLSADDPETRKLEALGWRVRNARTVAGTPWDYQHYVQGSLAEFSCAKPAYQRLGNAWLSDRTVCYLATGRPAVVEHTGPSAFLPDDAGLFRFRGREEAAACLERVVEDYEHQSALARAVAANCFDARRVTARALEVAV